VTATGAPARVIGVLGAGTMGAGIAQLAAQSGARTLLYDPDAEALERGLAALEAGVRKLVDKGELDGDAGAIAGRAEGVSALGDLAACDLVIEAVPEVLELKHELLGRLSREVLTRECVLASNTSSIPITMIAAAVEGRERVVGMHFFNPAPLMALVEVIPGIESGEAAIELARATGAAMGRRVILAADVPGFVVNRCNRPFNLEALRLLGERIACVEEIDRIVRLGGYRMGPFELQDLVGIDTGSMVARSFFALGFNEPRWRPSPLTERMVGAGLLGRKTKRGWYDYRDGGAYRAEDPPAPTAGGGEGAVAILGTWPVAAALRVAAGAAGWTVLAQPGGADLVIDCDGDGDGPRAILHHGADLAGEVVGFHGFPPLAAVELMLGRSVDPALADRAESFFASLGLHVARVGESPGGVLGRIVFQTINEACFALGEGVATAQDIDAGMTLGMRHPRGPLAWLELIGPAHVIAVLDALREVHGDAYRLAPALRRLAGGSEAHNL